MIDPDALRKEPDVGPRAGEEPPEPPQPTRTDDEPEVF